MGWKVIVFAVILTLFAITPQTSHAVTDLQVEKYESAKKAYYEKDFAAAERLFTELLDEANESALLRYNLGNVYLKQGHLGKAIREYERARLLDPRLADLAINLGQARAKVGASFAPSFEEYILGTFYFWCRLLTRGEFLALHAVLSVIFWGHIALRVWRRRRLVTAFTGTAMLAFAYLTAGLSLKLAAEHPGAYGVVLQPETEARASYLEKEETLFVVPEGVKVRLVDRQDFGDGGRWVRIQLPEGQAGWIDAEAVGEI